jgi:acyl carrier protein
MSQSEQTSPAGVAGPSVLDAVRSFVTQTFYFADDSPLDDEASLIEKGVIDSTGVLDLLAFVEQQFGIEPADGEIVPENFDSIGRLARFIESKVRG